MEHKICRIGTGRRSNSSPDSSVYQTSDQRCSEDLENRDLDNGITTVRKLFFPGTMLCIIYDLAKRETVHGKKMYRLLFVNNFLKKLLFEEKLLKLVKVTEPRKETGG